MKRASPSCDDLLVSRKRSCYVTEEENAGVNECCSSASPVQLTVNTPIKLPPGAVLLQELPAAAMEHVLDRTLTDADAALHLTLHAMSLATQIYEYGSADAADRALSIAEQALAATVQQLSKAQALVATKAQQHHCGLHMMAGLAGEEDADLQDTGSSSYSSACEAH